MVMSPNNGKKYGVYVYAYQLVSSTNTHLGHCLLFLTNTYIHLLTFMFLLSGIAYCIQILNQHTFKNKMFVEVLNSQTRYLIRKKNEAKKLNRQFAKSLTN